MSQLGLGMSTVDDRPRRSKSRGLLAVLVALVVVTGLLVGVIVFAKGLLGGGEDDYPGPGVGAVTVEITKGSSLTQMGATLADAGVVKSADAFVKAAEANDNAVQIQPGSYALLLQMHAPDVVVALLDPANRITEKVTIPEGLRVSGTVAVLAKETHLTAKQLKAVLKTPETLGLPSYAKDNPEGFLFPATYVVNASTDAQSQLEAMVNRFDEAASDTDLEERAGDVGLTPYEVVIVASILQAEARPDDFDKVARVIYNRIDQGMKLQLDTTVNFALGKTGLTVTTEDLKVDSPYNTYLHKGLPPGPISNPGEAAIEAALSPAPGPWLYYVTVNPKTGETKFTDSYQEFLRFKAEFQANR